MDCAPWEHGQELRGKIFHALPFSVTEGAWAAGTGNGDESEDDANTMHGESGDNADPWPCDQTTRSVSTLEHTAVSQFPGVWANGFVS